jgi:molybdopterin-containing oxidoreductase family membrane subunit
MSSYAIYWQKMIRCALVAENKFYYLWLGLLGCLVLIGAVAYSQQAVHGLIVTNLSDQVSWGAYIANFTFLVGIAAAAVLLVFPTYVLHRTDVKEVVLIGELLAFSAIIMCLLFVVVDLGHPERFLHLVPGFGKLNLGHSVLAWDVVVLNGYLLLNLHVPGYLLYMKYLGKKPDPRFYLPMVFVSIFWAVSVHTVTAFLYSGLGGRPFWNTAILAPRFLVSAFAGGPALLTIIFTVVKKYTALNVKDGVFELLMKIIRIFLPLNLFLLGCEVFTEFYTNSFHVESAKYLFFGIHGHKMLVPYIWTSLTLSVSAIAIFFWPRKKRESTPGIVLFACVAAIIGIWIEKGMGLIIPGFIPTPLGDLVEYTPSLIEFLVCLGIWSLGAMIFTILAKVAISIETGELSSSKG